MKALITTLLGVALLMPYSLSAEVATPDWVKAKPASMIYYTGVGSASLSDADYRESAKEKALADLISEIDIEVESSSLLSRSEVSGLFSESYAHDIRSRAKASLEGHELVESFNDGSRYYVYYQLDKLNYQNLLERRKKDATRRAFDYWSKGMEAKGAGELTVAADMFMSGLAAIEAYSNSRLPVEDGGRSIDVGVELFNSMRSLFSNLQIVAAPGQLEVKPFSGQVAVANIGVYSGSTPVKGARLKARFLKGGGETAVNSLTDPSGVAQLTVMNVTSKQPYQEVELRLDIKVPERFSTSYMKSMTEGLLADMPVGKLPLTVGQPTLRAILYTDDNEISGLLHNISGYLSNGYFDIVKDESQADLRFFVNSEFKVGGVVKGQLYDMAETFMSCNVIVTDLNSGAIVSNFGLNDVRSLAPGNSSVAKARTIAQREMFKKLKPLIERHLREAHFAPKAVATAPVDELDDDDDSSMPEL